MAPRFHRTAWLMALLLFMAACHDAPRTNPFDPALTPAVELQVALDDTAGTATLTWTHYEGQQPFREYQVLRNQIGLTRVDTLEHLTAVEQTTFVDTSLALDTDYEYWVSAVNTGGFAAPSEKVRARSLSLPPVRITRADFTSAAASASLAWTQYKGPRFKAYQVRRRTAEQVAQTVKETADIADTSLVDPGLLGNTEYFYQVVVLTERGEEVKSEEKTNAFHRLVGTFPLEGTSRSFVRLYREEDRIVALVLDRVGPAFDPYQERVTQFLFFDLNFQQLEEQTLLNSSRNWAFVDGALSISTAQNPAGQRFFGIAPSVVLGPVKTFGVLPFGPDGQAIVQEYPLFADAFPAPLPGAAGKVLGEIALLGRGRFDNVRVSTGERLLFAEDFSAFDDVGFTEAINGWEFSGSEYFLNSTGQALVTEIESVARRVDETWQNFRLEADISTARGGITLFGIQVGGDTFSRFKLQFDANNQQVVLNWDFAPPAELGLETLHQTFTAPFPIINGITSRLSLEVVDGQFRATVKSPVLLWAGVKKSASTWNNLVAIGSGLAFTVDEQAYSLTPTGQATPLSSIPSRVSELRVWEASNGHNVGVCLPEENQILMGRVTSTNESQWSTYIRTSANIGPRIGPEQGYLFYPLSFDVGPDGRIYVLDAGNARIVVFDRQRNYVTQWGRRGDGPGEFNFGSGEAKAFALEGDLDFSGSLAVDSQGYIYVADEINKRIQRFAP